MPGLLLSILLPLLPLAPVMLPAPGAGQPPHRVSFVTVAPNVKLEILDWGGAGRAMVFLAGFGDTGHVFDGFAPQFTTSYHVLAITRRGFGASTHPPDGYDSATLTGDIVAALDTLHIRKATFVAHSFGGSELNYLGAFHANRVSRLIYLDASYDFARLYRDSLWQHAFPIPRPRTPSSGALSEMRRWFALVVGPALPEHEIQALMSARAAGATDATFQRGAASVPLNRIVAPILAFWATPRSVVDQYPYWDSLTIADRRRLSESFDMQQSVRRRHVASFRAQLPHARVVSIIAGRHYVFLSHPREVAREMRAWLDRTSWSPGQL